MIRFPLKVAFRYLISKKSHTAVSVISVISVCAVAVTAMAMVCVLSVFNGFSDLVDRNLSLLDPAIRISPASGKLIENADSLLPAVRKIDGVEMATATVTDKALAIYGDKQTAITLKGVPDGYETMTDIASTVKSDGSFRLKAQDEALSVISVGTAVSLQAHPGYFVPLELYAPKRLSTINAANPASAFRKEKTFVAGVFEVGQAEYDMNHVFVPIELARRIFGCERGATAIEVKLAPDADINETATAIQGAVGNAYKVEDRLMQHSDSLKMISIEKWITFLLLGFILIIASFNVISTLAVLIIEKEESIRTLRSLGADNKMISRIFVMQGWLISVSGALIGITIGVVLCFVQQHFGIVKMSSSSQQLLIDAYPVIVRFSDVLFVLMMVALVGFFTSTATAVAMRRYLRK